jgi:NAD(P)-dependent dehydrogenase (short-subunit alcohol dehydrogenase family)
VVDGRGRRRHILAAMTGSEREAVLTTVAPEMMSVTTKRLVDPREVADAVLLLASPRSASTTGSEVAVDGGLLKTI